ncbi:MAG: hypothetical protein LBG30_05830 [Odoribacteraceae bacterium]|jgi:hypothetical protein|nr:hypothetical protein [Odoribacteraceae bacterium]
MRNISEEFLNAIPEIRWFIVEYFGDRALKELIRLAQNRQTEKLLDKLEGIWHELPYREFNRRVNPPGWKTFLSLIKE